MGSFWYVALIDIDSKRQGEGAHPLLFASQSCTAANANAYLSSLHTGHHIRNGRISVMLHSGPSVVEVALGIDGVSASNNCMSQGHHLLCPLEQCPTHVPPVTVRGDSACGAVSSSRGDATQGR